MSGEDYDEDDRDDDLHLRRDIDDSLDSPLERGCLFPGECCMPGPHYTCECHTAEMLLAAEEDATNHGPLSIGWYVSATVLMGAVLLAIGWTLMTCQLHR